MSPLATYRDRWIGWILRHPNTVLLLAGLVTVVALVLAARLRIDTDLRRLLPPDHPVVRSLDEYEATFGSTGSVNLVVKGGTVEARHAVADAIADAFADDPLIDSVDYRLPSEFFVEHALYYLDEGRMAELRRLVGAWSHYEFCRAAKDVCVGEVDPEAPDRLRAFIEAERERSWRRTGFRDYYERDGIEALVVLLRPVRPSSDLAFAQTVTRAVKRKVETILAPDGPFAAEGITINVVGPYVVKALGHATIQRDMLRSGLFALAGVVAILYVLFRSVRGVLVLLLPLCCGVAWSMGATYLVLGHLNSMTSLISTVVMGMGIDAGIHFYARIRRYRRSHTEAEAIRLAFSGLVVPLLVASATTMGAFVVMATSAFPVFREFGIIAAMGVAACLLAMVTVLPALSLRVGVRPSRSDDAGGARTLVGVLLARPGVWFALVVAATVFSFQGVRRVEFEYDGRKLQSDEARARTEADTHLISEIFGKDIHAGVLVVDDLPAARRALAHARRRHEARVRTGTSVVAELFGAPDLLPPAEVDLALRAKEIARLAADVPDTAFRRLRELAGEPVEAEPDADAGDNPFDEDGDWGVEDEGGEGWDDTSFEPAVEPEASGASGASGDAGDDGQRRGGVPPEPSPTSGGTVAGDGPLAGGAAGSQVAGGDGEGRPSPPNGAPAAAAGSGASKDGGAEGGETTEGALSPEDAKLLLRMLRAKPFVPTDLPKVVWRKVAAPDGKQGIFAYPAFDAANIRKGVAFMAETDEYVEDPQRQRFVGETTVYAAMYLALEEEAPVVLGMAAVLVTALVFWQIRQASWTALTLVPLGLGLWWMLAAMGVLGIHLTLFNLPILPAMLGIGVDNGVYLTDRIRRSGADPASLRSSVAETVGAIVAATTTTVVGFAAFLVADSGGLRSIGALAVVAITTIALAAVIVLPTVVQLTRRRARDRKPDTGASE